MNPVGAELDGEVHPIGDHEGHVAGVAEWHKPGHRLPHVLVGGTRKPKLKAGDVAAFKGGLEQPRERLRL